MSDYPPAQLRRLKLLGAIIDLVDAGEQQVIPGMLMKDSSDADERADLSVDVRALADEEMVHLDERYNGAWIARPTRAGRDRWANFTREQGDKVARAKKLRNDYLIWIYEQDDEGRTIGPDGFIESEPSYLSSPFTPTEVDKAGAWLKDHGFIRGDGSWGTPGPLRPSITAKGSDYVENGTDVHVDPRSAGTGPSYVFNAPAQVAHGSHDVRQVQNIGDVRSEAQRIADLLAQLVLLIGGDDGATLGNAATELREEAAHDARPERLKRIAESALRVLSAGAGGAVGSVVSDQLTEFLQNLAL